MGAAINLIRYDENLVLMDLYHFNRCSKSRQALQFLEQQSIPFAVIDYHNNPPSANTLHDLISRSRHEPIEFVRMNKNIELKSTASLNEIATYLSIHPQHMQRPVVDSGTQVIIARPLELLAAISDYSGLFSAE